VKKSFDQNVPKLRPRLKWQATTNTAPENVETTPPPAENNPHAAVANLAAAVRNKTALREEAPLTAVEALRKAIGEESPSSMLDSPAAVASPVVAAPPVVAASPAAIPPTAAESPAAAASPAALSASSAPALEQELAERRMRLKERLRAARETPGFIPLPPTAFQAGELAVERIAQLQIEISKLRDENLQLTQSLEAARRRAEEATETARMRVEEMEHVSNDMEERS